MKYIYAITLLILIAACGNDEAVKQKLAVEKHQQDSVAALGEMAKDSINKGIEKYDIESGKVEYISEFKNAKSSTRLLVFDHFGSRQLRATPFSMTLDRDGFSYNINPADSLGTKVYTENGDQFNPDLIDFKGLAKPTKDRFRYKEKGKGNILGRTCDIVEVVNGEMNITATYWLYKYVPLKMEISIMNDRSTITAVKFEENIPIDQHYFDLPKKLRKIVKVSNK